MANVGEIRARLVLSNDEFKRKMSESRGEMERTGFSAEQLATDFMIIERGALAVAGAVATAIGGSVKVAADFEQSMAQVRAVSGSTADEFARQEAAAREMGATTAFSASEAAEGLSYLAMAGFDVEQQISALPSVLNAALAGQIDLGQSADIVSNIMSGFSLEAEEAERAVDVLASTASSANTDIPQLGQAMSMVAPVAESLGWSMEETAAAIGELGNVGIQGSRAGTALRAALSSLANPTGQTKDAMEEFNIEVLDAEGNMKSLPELIGHVSEQFDGLTDAQKTQAATQLVGREAAAGFIALLNEGEDGLRDYTTELENSAGAAQEMADVQADTLSGAFKEFQSALQELGITVGNEFLPKFREIVEVGTDVVRAISEMDTSTLLAGITFAGTASAIALTITTIGRLVTAVGALAASMGPAGWLIAGLSVVGGLFAANKVTQEENVEVSLDHARALDEESTALSNQIDRYEELEAQNKLTNDELAEFVDLQSRIRLETDPGKIEEMSDRYNDLLEKSGFTNGEMDEFLGLNDEIIQKVPDSNIVLSEQGNVLLDNTDAARGYNEQLQKELELELRRQANEASTQLSENIQKRTEALEKQNDLAEDYIGKQREIENQQAVLATEEIKLQIARETGDQTRIDYAERQVEEAEKYLGKLEDQGYEIQGQIIEQEDIIHGIDEQIARGHEAYRELINYRLEQAEVTAEKGKEIEAIDEAIEKTQDLRSEVMEKHTVDGRVTEEGREQLDTLDEQLDTLGFTRQEVLRLQDEQNRLTGEIDDSVGVANDLNFELGQDIEKWLRMHGYSISDAERLNSTLGRSVTKQISLNYRETGAVGAAAGAAAGITRHQGGIAGREQIQDRLELHNGGVPQGLVRDLENRPLHNEIDVRLLRNEMVLTEGQQANLWRMIESGFTTEQGNNTTEGTVLNNNLTINSPKELSPSEIARVQERVLREFAMKM